MADRVVFETNTKTLHELCCKKRDEHGDFSLFEQVQKSDLLATTSRWIRELFSGKYESEWAGRWWANDEIQLTATGKVLAIVRHKLWSTRTEETTPDFILVSFQYCRPHEVQDRIAYERSVLPHWSDSDFTVLPKYPLQALSYREEIAEDN